MVNLFFGLFVDLDGVLVLFIGEKFFLFVVYVVILVLLSRVFSVIIFSLVFFWNFLLVNIFGGFEILYLFVVLVLFLLYFEEFFCMLIDIFFGVIVVLVGVFGCEGFIDVIGVIEVLMVFVEGEVFNSGIFICVLIFKLLLLSFDEDILFGGCKFGCEYCFIIILNFFFLFVGK